MQVNVKDVASGALFVAIGLYFAASAWFGLRIGRPFNMGPGYFPVILGLILVAFGVAIGASAINKPAQAIGAIPWRGAILVVGAVVFFAATVRGLGFLITVGVTTFMAALAPKDAKLKHAIALSVGLAVAAIAIFIYGLGLPYLVLGLWLEPIGLTDYQIRQWFMGL